MAHWCILHPFLVLQEGHSALHFACSFGNIEAIKYLVGVHGMNMNERNRVSVWWGGEYVAKFGQEWAGAVCTVHAVSVLVLGRYGGNVYL